MKKIYFILLTAIIATGCSTQKDLAYLNTPAVTGGEGQFNMEVPYYKIQPRDVIYVSVKVQTPEGELNDVLVSRSSASANYLTQSEASQYVSGYSVDPDGVLILPLLGRMPVAGNNIFEVKEMIQDRADSLFRHAYVEIRMLSFRFTVLGEVKTPGCYVNYNNQLTVLEAIGFAGGITDVGNRRDVMVVRPVDKQTVTYTINLQDKSLLSSPAYFLAPNDVVIVQAGRKKVFNLNLPTYSFILTTLTSTITSTLLLVNYFHDN